MGKIIITLGILSLFRQVQGGCGFADCFNNSWEILITSLIILLENK